MWACRESGWQVKIHNVDQRSADWFRLRAGIVTASCVKQLVTPKWKIKTGDGPATYLATKLAEKWLGRPMEAFSLGGAVEIGRVLEDEAIPYFELETGVTLNKVGFITSEDGLMGCSPDGLIGDGPEGAEIKCPQPHTHAAYLIDGVLPEEYGPQVHGSMYVTGAKRWYFLSYCRDFPPLLLCVERDEKIIAVIHEAVTAHAQRLQDGYARLVELNGGEPERKEFTVSSDGTTATMAGVDADELDAFFESEASERLETL